MITFKQLPSRIIAGLVWCAVIFAVFAQGVLHPIDQDEEQYVAGAYFAQDLTLYQDFIYFQPPIYPLILSAVFKMLPGSYYFLAARFVVSVFAVATIWIFYLLASRILRNTPAAGVLTLVFATLPLTQLTFGATRNDSIPMLFGLLGVWLLLTSFDREALRAWKRFAGGAMFAFAVGVKLTSAFLPIVSVPYLYYRIRSSSDAGSALPQTLFLIAGGAFGALPILYYFIIAPGHFYYSIYEFHTTLPVNFYTIDGSTEFTQYSTKFMKMMRLLSSELGLVIAVMLAALFVVLRRPARSRTAWPALSISESFYLLALCLVALPLILAPSPWWRQYAMPVVPYVFLGTGALYCLIDWRSKRVVHYAVIGCALLSLLLQAGRLFGELKHIADVDRWAPVQTYKLSSLIKATLADEGANGPVASLYPLLILDAGGHVNSRFATGIYFYRSGNDETVDRVIELNTASPNAIKVLFEKSPPAALFGGGTDVDETLRQWAIAHCYVDHSGALKDRGSWPYHAEHWVPWLYVRPSDAACGQS